MYPFDRPNYISSLVRCSKWCINDDRLYLSKRFSIELELLGIIQRIWNFKVDFPWKNWQISCTNQKLCKFDLTCWHPNFMWLYTSCSFDSWLTHFSYCIDVVLYGFLVRVWKRNNQRWNTLAHATYFPLSVLLHSKNIKSCIRIGLLCSLYKSSQCSISMHHCCRSRRQCFVTARACEILIWWSGNGGCNCWFVSVTELNTSLGKINQNTLHKRCIQSNQKSNNGWCEQQQKNLKKFSSVYLFMRESYVLVFMWWISNTIICMHFIH